MRIILWLQLLFCLAAAPALAEKDAYLTLARKGWNYELRSTMVGRDMSIPVHINGRDLAGAALCVVGEEPHPATLIVLDAFRDLIRHTYGKPLPMRYAGPNARSCGSGRVVLLRLYSGFPPNSLLTEDLVWMNRNYLLGLPAGRNYAASSPAMAQTFFGRRGQGTHIMVKQPRGDALAGLERAFYKSILLEELYQSFTFGMDVLMFDRSRQFLSKLQETPVNLARLSWNSHRFMRMLVASNPGRLCPFDIFMLHAVARAPVDQTTGGEFIRYIDGHFNELLALSEATLAQTRFAPLLDTSCSAPI